MVSFYKSMFSRTATELRCSGSLKTAMLEDGRLFYGVDGGPNFTEAFEITSGNETQITAI